MSSLIRSGLPCVLQAVLLIPAALLPRVSAGDPFESPEVASIRIQFTEAERAALEPAAVVAAPFGGPMPPPGQGSLTETDSAREKVANLFGVQFPWVHGTLIFQASSDDAEGAVRHACRVRYDGEFTYLMAGPGPKRPLFVELLDGGEIHGARAFRFHTMQTDASMIRERLAGTVVRSFQVPVPRAMHVEVSFVTGDGEPQDIGLYTVQEAVDAGFLARHQLPDTSPVFQLGGLTALRYAGDDWNAYGFVLRSPQVPSPPHRQRILEFLRLISESTEDEFRTKIGEFLDIEALLRYVAAHAVTSNLTGFSSLGVNDFMALDPTTGRFHLIAAELENALGGAVLSGTPEQLADLSIMHPFAGDCPLFERLLKIDGLHGRYRDLMRDAVESHLGPETMTTLIQSLEHSTAAARQRDGEAAAERLGQLAAATPGGGAGGPGFGGPGFGGPAALMGAVPQPLALPDFVRKRIASLERQLTAGAEGYLPPVPNFGGFGGGSPAGGGGGPREPITEREFVDAAKVPEGFRATLFARAPDVNYPVAIAAEPTGAIYVASDEQGSLGTDPNGGRVLRCADDDGDGTVDRVTVFCRVDHVRGVVYRNGTVWVCHPPDLSVFHDDDGDGIADRSRKLVTGLTTELVNTRGGDHTTNGIRMGIDGWLYIGDGDYGVPGAEGTDGSRVTLRGGGILRVRPDGTELEVFASGLRNPFDIAIDPRLNMFTRDNTNDGGGWDTRVSQLFQSAEYGYPLLFANFSDEIMPTLGSFGNGGGTGSLFIEDNRWPARFNNALFTGDWGRSGVFHHPLAEDGPTFRLKQEDFATVPRATGMDLDAAGHLYVASWWSGEASVYVGPQVGFVTRISPEGLPETRFPVLPDASVPELIELLRRPQAVTRFHVQGELIRRGSSAETVPSLTAAVRDASFPLPGRIAALFALKEIQGAASHPLLMALLDDASIREFAIRALADRRTQVDGVSASLLSRYLDDDSLRVRAQTLIAMGRLGDATLAGRLLSHAAVSGSERPDASQPNSALVIPHLALRALVATGAAEACLAAVGTENWQEALRALRFMPAAAVVDGLLARLNAERDDTRRRAILVTLIRLCQRERPYDGSWWGIRPDTTGPYYDPVPWEQSERIRTVLTTAVRESDAETAALLRAELARHQLRLPGIGTQPESTPEQVAVSVIVHPVDPGNLSQIGNLDYDQTVLRTTAVSGNPQAGQALFQSRSCVACHTSAPGQQPIGPHLVEIGKRYKTAELIESVLRPSAKIAQGYETQVILLAGGQVVTGFVTRENGREIVLRDSQGRSHVVPRNEIEERTRQQLSAMPEGLASSLLPEELADLIAYLQSL